MVTDRLQILQAGCCQPQVGQLAGKAKGAEEREQLLPGLGRQPAPPQHFFQAKLGQDPEAHLFPMKARMGGWQLGEAIVHGMGGHGAAAGPAQATDEASGESGGFRHPHPGL